MMRKLASIAVTMLIMAMCSGSFEVQAINVKERTETKSELKQSSQKKQKYVGDPMLMQANEPAHVTHMKDQSMELAQMTSSTDKSKPYLKYDEMDTGMVILIVVITIVVIFALICCCCYCCAWGMYSAEKRAELEAK